MYLISFAVRFANSSRRGVQLKLKIQILEHWNNISNPGNYNISNVTRQFIDSQNSNIDYFQVYGIKRVRYPPRGMDIEHLLDFQAC